ncbi:MAG: MFS transporter [Bifidobacteriaceae bacterium]|jgi:MFS family permease|nr:MFS transporter [Bifidobacteriaceae bacterium]
MLTPYKKIFQYPEAKKFALVGIICRFPQPIYQMSILFVTYSYISSWAIPATLASTVALTYALATPFFASLIDKYGQSFITLKLTIIYLCSLTGLICTFIFHLPYLFLFLFAGLSGISQYYYGSLTRTRWNYIIKNPKHLHTAYAYESACDDFAFILGPVIGVILANSPLPIISLLIVFLIAGTGNLFFATLKSTEPPIKKTNHQEITADKNLIKPIITIHGVPFCVATAFILGVNFGLTNVTISAIYTKAGYSIISGFVLAIGSISSLVGGLLYGLIHTNIPQTKRMLILTILTMCVLINYTYTYNNIFFIPIVVFGAGFVVAPLFTCLNSLMRDIVPNARLTQGFSWISSTVNLGSAAGSLIAGITIDKISIQTSLIILIFIFAIWNLISYPWSKAIKIDKFV